METLEFEYPGSDRACYCVCTSLPAAVYAPLYPLLTLVLSELPMWAAYVPGAIGVTQYRVRSPTVAETLHKTSPRHTLLQRVG